MNSLYRKQLGNLGEKIAMHFLYNQGYQLIQRNYLIRGGQIDLIMTSPIQKMCKSNISKRPLHLNSNSQNKSYQVLDINKSILPQKYINIKSQTIHFVEVKTRQYKSKTNEITLSYRQMMTLKRTAENFLMLHNLEFATWQLDLISINLKLQKQSRKIETKIKYFSNILEL